ncbi:hypothetical protein NMR80_002550 [Vibrio cholerae]|nr:hypothetical protein [Vibrio cholerae]
MRQKRKNKTSQKQTPLISNENISRQFRVAIQGFTYRGCAEIFNASEQAKLNGISVTKDTVCRLATGNFQVVNKRIKALCQFFNIDFYEKNNEVSEFAGFQVSGEGEAHGIDAELSRVSSLAKRNPALEGKLTNLIRGITEIVSSQGV